MIFIQLRITLKYFIVRYYHDTSIKKDKLFNDLDVQFDSKLCFNSHILNITYKTFTRKIFNLNIFSVFRNLYFAFVRSHLEYAIQNLEAV